MAKADIGTLEGRVGIVTGAGQGGGYGCALALAARGVKMALFGRTMAKLDTVVKEIEGRGGTAIAIGFAGGAWEPLDPARLVGRNVGAAGLYLGRLLQREPELTREALNDLLRLWVAGELHPIVGATFPLAEAAAAHRLVEDRHSTGKVVLIQ